MLNGTTKKMSHAMNPLGYQMNKSNLCGNMHRKKERKLSKYRVDMLNEQTDYDTVTFKWSPVQCLYLCIRIIMLSKRNCIKKQKIQQGNSVKYSNQGNTYIF